MFSSRTSVLVPRFTRRIWVALYSPAFSRAEPREGEFCTGGDANVADGGLKRPALGPRLLGSSRVACRPKIANKLLTREQGTIDIIQHIETVCD
jgi:hypothetical protein